MRILVIAITSRSTGASLGSTIPERWSLCNNQEKTTYDSLSQNPHCHGRRCRITGAALASSSGVLAKGKGGGGGGMGGGMGGGHGAHGQSMAIMAITATATAIGTVITSTARHATYDSCWRWTGYRWINVCIVPY